MMMTRTLDQQRPQRRRHAGGVSRSCSSSGFLLMMTMMLVGVSSLLMLPARAFTVQRMTVSVFGVQQPPSTRKTTCLFSSDPNQDPFGSYFNAHPEAQQPQQPQQSQSPPPPVQPQQQPPPPGFEQQQQVPPSSNFGAPPPPPPVPPQPQQQPPVTTNNNNASGAPPPPLGQQPQPQSLNNNNPNNINNDGFTTNRNNDVVYQSAIRPQVPVSPGTAGNAAGRYFQLEENEDAESATTEIFLQDNGQVAVGETDGPLYVHATGEWQQGDTNNNDFVMTITRRYEAGVEEREATAMGVFEFDVERSFQGQITMIGDCMAVEGVVWSLDDLFGDKEVGFFNMIDTTNARLGEEEENNNNNTNNSMAAAAGVPPSSPQQPPQFAAPPGAGQGFPPPPPPQQGGFPTF